MSAAASAPVSQLRNRHPPLPSAAADGPRGCLRARLSPTGDPGSLQAALSNQCWARSGMPSTQPLGPGVALGEWASHSAWPGDKMVQSEQLQCFRGGPAARDVGRRPPTSTGACGPDAGPPAPRPSSGRLDLWPPRRLSRVPHPEITPSGRAHLCPRPATDVGAPLTPRDRAHTLCREEPRGGHIPGAWMQWTPTGASKQREWLVDGDRHGKFLCCFL